MSARKLRRVAGLALVLAVALGGASSVTPGASSVAAGGGAVVEATATEIGWD